MKTNPRIPNVRQNEPKSRRPLTKEMQRRIYFLVANTIALFFIYFGCINVDVTVIPAGKITDYPILLGQIVYLAYWLAFAVVLLAYFIYNRAFTRKNITPDMLPPTWSAEKRLEYVEDGKRRLEKSKWMLSLIIPLLVTIAADAIYLFTWPMIQNLFNIK